MLVIQNFLNKWRDDMEEGNKWLMNQHPVQVTKDFLAVKLTPHEQRLSDVYLYSCDHNLRYHTRISDECNGLILDDDQAIVSKGFNRIHNVDKRHYIDIDWSHTFIERDYSGKIVVIYNHKGTWFISTNRSIHAGDLISIPSQGITCSYRTAVENFIKNKNNTPDLQTFMRPFDKKACFVCIYMNPEVHLCGPRGKEDLILLGVIDKMFSKIAHGREMFSAYVDDLADMAGFGRPSSLETSDKESALAVIEQLEPWRRGIIIKDNHNSRVRAVNPKYKLIRRLLKAENDFTTKQLIAMFLTGAGKAVSIIEPRYNGPLKIFNTMIDKRWKITNDVWDKAKDASCQKEFAESVDHSLLSYILFHVRKHGPIDRTEFIQAIKPRLVEGFIKNIGELDAFNRSIEKAKSQGEVPA